MKVTVAIGLLAAAASASDVVFGPQLAPRGDVPGYGHGNHGGGKDKCKKKPLVNSRKLQASIKEKNLLAGAEKLQSFANAYPERNRVMGSSGHNDTVNWLVQELSALDGYYTVETQAFSNWVQISGNFSFFVNGAPADASMMDFSATGNVTGNLVPVSNLGCEPADYPAEVEGQIALISRGTCQFGVKSALAGSAGAIGALIYNNEPGKLAGTLGAPGRPEGDYVPTLSLTQDQGLEFIEQINGGTAVSATLNVVTHIENVTTNNVVATSNCGNKNTTLVLGAHTDSVSAGPGINDDGSGVVGILEVAKALSKYRVNNAVTFGFWSGEEINLLGSTHFVETASAEKLATIRAYLNFDMIASPNYIHALYDGDGNAFNQSGPAGSAEIEHFFQEWFTSQGQNWTATAFDGRSDYLAFIEAGIPAGGTFTGAEDLKTEEQAIQFGGTAGEALDPNYHQAGDTVDNLSMEAFVLHTKAIAASVAKYATSFDSLPPKEPVSTRKRSTYRRSNAAHAHGPSSGCAKHTVI